MDYLDSESIIAEIQKYPFIYDVNHNCYKNLVLKRGAWLSIAQSILGDKWEDMDESTQRNMAKEAQKRWKSIKDSYVKNIKKIHRRGKVSVKVVRPYIFHKQLSFLKPIILKDKSYENKKVHQQNDDNVEIITLSNLSNIENEPQCSNMKRKNIVEREAVNFDKITTYEPKHKTCDPDEMFLLSQIPMIKRLNPSEKLDFQVKFMQLLQTYTPSFNLLDSNVNSPTSSNNSSSEIMTDR